MVMGGVSSDVVCGMSAVVDDTNKSQVQRRM